MSERNLAIPSREEAIEEPTLVEEAEKKVEQQEPNKQEEVKLTKQESEFIEKVFFEEDEKVTLRDGKTYAIPPLGLKDAKNLMKKLNTIDTGVIIANLIADETGNDSYDELLEVLLMGFKPYYKEISAQYLGDYIDIVTAKEIIDIMIGLNGLKKSL
ncbi:DNA polymerase III subunit gamma/tau [Bacillus toyonensis]|uniref:DNA polymerase III subunit gamma/tau n=1 Tax=Bacillus thuringiensis TaxID=1428 RepID=A0A9X7GDS0_BACTU|nr:MULTISPECIES: DNA polymerase III subunit gamma/tau [Bacillus]KAA0767558.1 DNA polymerase III subunit gamma/tau [Bacillus sp. TE8-1]MBG9612546.1 DNA polymerase III subunit gamma/tau [Bacillus cereus]MCI4247986.1 DNA polymerase III subunit gamma/tau [Bacillus sp. CCB-MMP212]MDA2339761.1 DNA polymerase III subunit gamma/tau [Bacillus cereus]MDA2343264.1 DNA polymerase III subunit gamma/tau [Bacillus cereus]